VLERPSMWLIDVLHPCRGALGGHEEATLRPGQDTCPPPTAVNNRHSRRFTLLIADSPVSFALISHARWRRRG